MLALPCAFRKRRPKTPTASRITDFQRGYFSKAPWQFFTGIADDVRYFALRGIWPIDDCARNWCSARGVTLCGVGTYGFSVASPSGDGEAAYTVRAVSNVSL